jgi:hypothetical protein
MSVTSVLKVAEQDAAKAFKWLLSEAPLVEGVAETVAVVSGNASVVPFIEKVSSIVTNAGAIATSVNAAATGADKLAVAAPAVDSLIKNSGFLGTTAIADVSKWDTAVKAITGAFADLLASLEAKKPVAAPAPVAEQPAVTLAPSQA